MPPFLKIRNVPNQGKGIYTTKSISRGQTIFSSPSYSFGVGGVTVDDVRGACHHCLAIIKDPKSSIVCSKCKVAGYCGIKCLHLAQPLHSMECEGLAKMELLRGTESVLIICERDHQLYWPPPEVLMIARAINRRILQGADRHVEEWLKQLARHELPPTRTDAYLALIRKLVHILVPDHVRDDEIDQMFRAVCINAAEMLCPPNTSASAIYFEFSMLNHMCHPNCGFENDNTIANVYALQDIEYDCQLGISYLNSDVRVNERKIRRKELKKLYGFDCHCRVCLEEKVVGSEYWLMDQQKRSLIAPWSRQMADEIIEKGWKSIRESERMERLQAIKLLESEIEVQKLVLDKTNVTLILTTWQLIRNYSLLPDHKKGIQHLKSLGEIGMNAFFNYCTTKEIDANGSTLIRCFSEVGLPAEASELSKLLFSFFPKAPSSDLLRMSGVPSSMIKSFKEHLLQPSIPRKDIQVQQIVSHILKVCDLVQ